MIHRLDGLVDDAMPHSENCFPRIAFFDVKEEASCAILELSHRFHIRRPNLVLEVGDEPAGEAAPIALAQQSGGFHRHVPSVGNERTGVDGALQV